MRNSCITVNLPYILQRCAICAPPRTCPTFYNDVQFVQHGELVLLFTAMRNLCTTVNLPYFLGHVRAAAELLQM